MMYLIFKMQIAKWHHAESHIKVTSLKDAFSLNAFGTMEYFPLWASHIQAEAILKGKLMSRVIFILWPLSCHFLI